MGNAHILMKDEVMKDEADWVAPKMEEDKAAYVIAKFFESILHVACGGKFQKSIF